METVKRLGQGHYSPENDEDRHPFHLYYRTLQRLLHLVREQGHGGTLLVLPEQLGADDPRLADKLSIKYVLDVPSVWNTLIDEAEAKRNYLDLFFDRPGRPLMYAKRASASKLKNLIDWERRHENAERRIAQYCNFVASLSAVDGAVVLSRDLVVLGFGAEILATSVSLGAVRQVLDPEGNTGSPLFPEAFGTRHRSAMRMCASFEDCVALVVSQDGPVKAIKRVEAELIVWNDVTLGRQTL
jgi:hypothetical protein